MKYRREEERVKNIIELMDLSNDSLEQNSRENASWEEEQRAKGP